jgi:glycerophosphoryl diester phosphodiesterase
MPDGSCPPENSLAAFHRAEADGLPFEIDVRLLRDGTPIVFHDDALARMTGAPGRVGDMSWREVSPLRLRSARGPSGEPIPTLGEVLDRTRGGVLVELKGGGRGASLLVEATLRELERRPGAGHRVAIQSFDPEIVAAVAARDPSLFRCQLVSNRCGARYRTRSVRRLLHVSSAHAVAVNLHWTSRPATKGWQARGLWVLGWTAKGERDVRHGHRLGLDRLITDFVPAADGGERASLR